MTAKLDYNAAREIVYLAVRRASVFMGLGINAARDERLNDASLSKEVNMEFVRFPLAPAELAHVKAEFEAWIIVNGLRELIEGFAAFLDRLYQLSLLASHVGKPLTADYRKKMQKYRQRGMVEKFDRLNSEFGIHSNLSPHLSSIYLARNCLSHDRGIVRLKQLNTPDCLEVTWRAVDLLMQRENGDEEKFHLGPKAEPIEGPGTLAARIVIRTKRFKLGENIRLTVTDLAEICAFAYLAADGYAMPAIEYAKKMGVKNPDPTPPDPESPSAGT